MVTNCPNCGAPITGLHCEYCGTQFKDRNIQGSIDGNSFDGELEIGGQAYKVYLANMQVHSVFGPCVGRSLSGELLRDKIRYKRTFTLIEI